MPRTDYPANRGPLDGREYTHRKPDGFSTCAGCLFLLLAGGVSLAAATFIVAQLPDELLFALAGAMIVWVVLAWSVRHHGDHREL